MGQSFVVLELIGTAAFAVSGATAAIDKHTDVFGVIFLGITTALGGGILRDIFLGDLPPRMFGSYAYVLLAAVCALVVFYAARIWRSGFERRREKLEAVVNVFDALGLGVFTVSGVNLAVAHEGLNNFLLIIFLGMATGVGGGMLRDVLIGEIPFVLRKRVYAVASLAGGSVCYLMSYWGCAYLLSALCGIAVVFVIRVLATVFKWSLPKIS